MMEKPKEHIMSGATSLGVELGSTRIKAVLAGPDHAPIASGGYSWENRLENDMWTYHLEDVRAGLAACFADLACSVRKKYGVPLSVVGSIGISGMMHGYLAFDKEDRLLVPFRTWRNTNTGQAAEELTELLSFNIPLRWSVSHLYQAVLNREPHVTQVAHITTLAGYVHYLLTGQRVMGVGEASGMFPIDSSTCNYNLRMAELFDLKLAEYGLPYKFADIMPKVLAAGEPAGRLTPQGAGILDPAGVLKPGIPLCPPEGDAGTGMVATNSIAERTGNVSAGTSVFAMLVLERPLSKGYREIDMVTTPDGKPVAMVHCNNCSSDIDAWAQLLREFAGAAGVQLTRGETLDLFFNASVSGAADCGGLASCNYFSGEPTTGFFEGRPLFLRLPDAQFSLANFVKTHLCSAIASLKIGMDVLLVQEQAKIDRLFGHGGYFKAKGVGQQLLASALGVPVSVNDAASEGGAWGSAILAAFMKNRHPGESLDQYLDNKVFAHQEGSTLLPIPEETAGFAAYMERYRQCLKAEQAAVEAFR